MVIDGSHGRSNEKEKNNGEIFFSRISYQQRIQPKIGTQHQMQQGFIWTNRLKFITSILSCHTIYINFLSAGFYF